MKVSSQLIATLCLPLAVLAATSHSNFHLSERPELEIGPKSLAKPHLTSAPRNRTCIVDDSAEDDAPAILAAAEECNNGGILLFPEGVTYSVGTRLNLTFLQSVDLDIQGTIQFTNDTTYWNANGFNLTFQNASTFWMIGGEDVNIYGGGTLDGNGQVWYDLYAENDLILRPILLSIIELQGGSVSDINLRFSPQWYNVIMNSSDVVYSNITIAGLSTSENTAKNTDGWDTYRSDSIVIQNSNINNGDDCVSFKPNSTNILVQNLICNGSHGISVGSLGQYPGEFDLVENVYVFNISMSDASDGARIKVWPGTSSTLSEDLQGGGGNGNVNNITYDTMVVKNVDYAIELTQCYGQSNMTLCNEFPSNLTISDIWFINFSGTTSKAHSPEVGTLVCSSPDVCSDINAVNISVNNPSGTAPTFVCSDVDDSTLDFTCVNT